MAKYAHASFDKIAMASAATHATLAPVVLFVYKRLEHTKKTLEALQNNLLANQSDLIIYSDAAKNASEAQEVENVRAYIQNTKGFKSVNVIEREENWGLAASIIDGVTAACKSSGKVIVVEDDLVTSPYFLDYMNDALKLYACEEKVMHISGSTYPANTNNGDVSYFLNLPLCWGWATWSRAWSQFVKDINVMKKFDNEMISTFDFDDTNNYWEQLELNREGKIDTWFVYWYAVLFLQNGLSLFPGKSLVQNIGMDGTGVHCTSTSDYDVDISMEPVKLGPIPLNISEQAFDQHKIYFRSIGPKIHSRFKRKILNFFKRFR